MSSAANKLEYGLFKVSLGWCAAARSGKGICRFVLPVATAEAAEAELLRDLRIESESSTFHRRDASLRPLAGAVARYFEGGKEQSFRDFPVDLSSGTPFQRQVWNAVRRIRHGQVRAYRDIGVEIGRPNALRAVGRAVGANPVPLLVPCHRVLGSDGSLVGFSAAGGIGLKAKMLAIEGVRLRGEGTRRRVVD